MPRRPSDSSPRRIVPIVTIVAIARWLAAPQINCSQINAADIPMPSNHIPTDVAPFPAYACADRYVALGSVEETIMRVGRSIEAHEAISLIIGPPGTGKTLICSVLAEQFAKSHDIVHLGDTTMDDRAAFLRHLLHHLGVDYKQTAENDLHLALVDRVTGKDSAKEGLLILIDESQTLAPEVFESIRLATNIMRAGKPRVTAVVAGAMKLDEVLVDHSLEPFVQRIATRCYLHPMNHHETRHYIRETIAACGANPEATIADDAIAAIHHACSGVPRLVNQMMTQAIDTAADNDVALIDEAIIDKAWATLQQLPSPMIDEPSLKSSVSSTIEFGELDSDSDWSKPAKTKTPSPAVAPENTFADDDACDFAEPTCDLRDIQVGSSAAMWVDEATPPIPTVNPHTMPISGPMSGKLQTKPRNDAPATALPKALFGDFDDEEDLSLRGDGTLAFEPVRDETQTTIPMRRFAEPSHDLESMLHQEIIGLSTFDDTAMVMPDSRDYEANELDEENFCDDEDVRLSHDDSDILVIEDELELTRMDGPSKRSDSVPQGMTIDFQSMLSRMRAGS